MDQESYNNFCEWLAKRKDEDGGLKASPLLKEGQIYLECARCDHEIVLRVRGEYWNISNFLKHRKTHEFKVHEPEKVLTKSNEADDVRLVDVLLIYFLY